VLHEILSFKIGSSMRQLSFKPPPCLLRDFMYCQCFSMLSVKWLMPSRERDDVTTC